MKISFLALVFLSSLTLFFLVPYKKAQEKSLNYDFNYQEARKKWAKIISASSPTSSYLQFKSEFKNEHHGIRHNMAHIIGEIFSDKYNTAGIAYCDSDFEFGCYHGFFMSIVSKKGTKIIPALAKSCLGKSRSAEMPCQHGIGHGLLLFLKDNNLYKALDICATIQKLPSYAGCVSGVFMEYFIPVLVNAKFSTESIKQLEPDKPYSICTEVKKPYKQACYFSLGQWWNRYFNKDYNRLGAWCSKLKDKTENVACFKGIGNIVAPSSEYDSEKTIKDCQKISDKKGAIYCLQEASHSFAANSENAYKAASVCKYLNNEQKKYCSL